jgi:hypothetical protein
MYTKELPLLSKRVLDGLLWNVGIVGSIFLWTTSWIFSWKPLVLLILKKCYFNFYESFLEYKPVIYLNAHKEHLEGLTCHKMFWKKHLKWWSLKKKDESNTTNQLQQFSPLIFKIVGCIQKTFGGWIFIFWWEK